jgi:hypothetical protein
MRLIEQNKTVQLQLVVESFFFSKLGYSHRTPLNAPRRCLWRCVTLQLGTVKRARKLWRYSRLASVEGTVPPDGIRRSKRKGKIEKKGGENRKKEEGRKIGKNNKRMDYLFFKN